MLKKCISGTQNRQTLKITLQYKRRKKLIIFVRNLQEHFVMIKFLFRSLKAVQYFLGVHRNIYECHRLSSIELCYVKLCNLWGTFSVVFLDDNLNVENVHRELFTQNEKT